MATYYVNEAGSGTADGLSRANRMSWATFITNINAASAGGDDWYVNGAIALAATQTISVNAPANLPHRVMGDGGVDGDWDQGYGADGALVTTNFFNPNFTGNFQLVISGANILVFGLNAIGERLTVGVVRVTGSGSNVFRSRIENFSTGANAVATDIGSGASHFVDCDIIQSAASGGAPAAQWGAAAAEYINCRASSVSGPGFYSNYAFGVVLATHCTVLQAGTHAFVLDTTGAGAQMRLLNCTAYNYAGNALEVTAGVVGVIRVLYSHLTDGGGFGVDLNAATASLVLHSNRYRDNVSGALNVGARQAAVEYGAVTTDTGGVETDFVNAAGGDLRLIYNAPGMDDSVRGVSIGASGLEPTDPAAGGGGGGGARRVPIFIPIRE